MNIQKEYGYELIFMGVIILMLIGCVRVKVETPGHKTSFSGERSDEIVQPPREQYCQVPPFAQQSEVIHSFNVTKHPNVTLRPEDADKILSEATKVAREREEEGRDFPCRITLERKTSTVVNIIADFTMNPGDLAQPNSNDCFVFGEICSEFDFEILNALEPEGVKVVEEITWCQRTGTALIVGCSKLKGHSMAVARYCTNEPCPILEGVLWLHEFGHNKDLLHRPLDDSEKGVMYPGVYSENTSLNECECQSLRKKDL